MSDTAIFSQVRCPRCKARLFDARPAWRPSEVSVADVVILCWRCNRLVGVKFIFPEDGHD